MGNRISQRGFAAIEFVAIFVVVTVLVGAAWMLKTGTKDVKENTDAPTSAESTELKESLEIDDADIEVLPTQAVLPEDTIDTEVNDITSDVNALSEDLDSLNTLGDEFNGLTNESAPSF